MTADDLLPYLVGGFGSLGTYLLHGISKTLTGQAAHVLDIDVRLSRLEGEFQREK